MASSSLPVHIASVSDAIDPPLTPLERRLLDEFQRDFPLQSRPYAEMAVRLGVSEREVIETLSLLESRGLVSRVGPVFAPHRCGTSTLAAIAVPAERLDEVAALVSSYREVNHNYEREHPYNLWFVATAADATALARVIADIRERSGLDVMTLPLEHAYHIDLGFRLWN